MTMRIDVALNNYAALIADHRYSDAEALDRAISLVSRFRSTDKPIYLDTLGWLHYRKGDFAVAAAFLERAATLAPAEPVHRYHLGMAVYKSGQKQRALEELERALGEGADYHGIDEARSTYAQLQGELRGASERL
jgi:tetratricopeptide (TPR) repeat protein